jgi:uncharacterized protein DUF4154
MAGRMLTMFCLVLFASTSLTQADSQSNSSREYQIKSALMFNVLKFIDWPKEPKSTSETDAKNAPLRNPAAKLSAREAKTIFIALIAEPDVYNACKIIQEKKIKNQTIRVNRFPHRQVKDPNVLLPYDLVYMTAPTKSLRVFDVSVILNTLKKHRILTIGEIPRFLERGGMINFVREQNHILFEINLDVMRQEGFAIKAQLLRLAKRVIKKPSSQESGAKK